jgi:hypothetical protein
MEAEEYFKNMLEYSFDERFGSGHGTLEVKNVEKL